VQDGTLHSCGVGAACDVNILVRRLVEGSGAVGTRVNDGINP